jgi:hypothetical protein
MAAKGRRRSNRRRGNFIGRGVKGSGSKRVVKGE